MTNRAEAMSPIEVRVPWPQRIQFNEITNDELQKCELQLLEEMRDAFQTKSATYQ